MSVYISVQWVFPAIHMLTVDMFLAKPWGRPLPCKKVNKWLSVCMWVFLWCRGAVFIVISVPSCFRVSSTKHQNNIYVLPSKPQWVFLLFRFLDVFLGNACIHTDTVEMNGIWFDVHCNNKGHFLTEHLALGCFDSQWHWHSCHFCFVHLKWNCQDVLQVLIQRLGQKYWVTRVWIATILILWLSPLCGILGLIWTVSVWSTCTSFFPPRIQCISFCSITSGKSTTFLMQL